METNLNRVSAGVPTGGQFAAASHAEPSLTLEEAPAFTPDFDTDFEAAYGAGLTRALESLPKSAVRDRVHAGRLADLIRESNPDYMEGGETAYTQAEANQLLASELSNLEPGRRAELTGLIRFAVHNEVKHVAARDHVLNPDHDYELLIDTADYDGDDDLVDRGNDDNREQWQRLADAACLVALNENIHASYPKAA